MDDDEDSYTRQIFCLIFVVYLIFNLPWIIPDLIFAYQDLLCVTIIPQGFAMNLSTWLQVDAYVRVAATSIVLIITVIVWFSSQQFRQIIQNWVIAFSFIILAFTSIWAIVGSIMFWGHLNPEGLCTGPVQAYLYAFLIISNIITGIMLLFVVRQILKGRTQTVRVVQIRASYQQLT